MQITRLPSLSESGFLGCTSAFVDSLFGELNSAAMYMHKLEGQPKGSAFAYEMSLDSHRYAALLVLDRWATLVHTFGPCLKLGKHQAILDQAPGRVQTAENLLGRANDIIDSTEQYSGDVVAACLQAFQSLRRTFAEEGDAADESARLGPLLPGEYREARRMFLEDLAKR